MSTLWLPVIWLSACFLLLFVVAELLYRRAHVQAEYTRKMVHAGTGLLTLLFPVFLTEVWQVSLLCGSFLALLIVSLQTGWLPSINAVERKTAGSWLFPIIVLLTFAFYRYAGHQNGALFMPLYYFYTPLLLLAICDPVAALAGGYWKRRHPETAPGKTFAGSFSFLGMACIICIAAAVIYTNHRLPAGFFIATGMTTAFATTLAERFSDRGWDNFTIPVAAMLCIWATDYAL
jgi:phosphatidate cytidylyltransferase/phytol kinase